MDAAVVGACEALVRGRNFQVVAYCRDDLFCTEVTPETEELADRYNEPRPRQLPSLEKGPRANKLLILGDA